MKVFISWSGRQSQEAAQALREWLPCVIQHIRPFVSSDDIRKGGRWSVELSKELEATKFGILILTPDNISSPWLHFEAGALTKSIDQSYASTVLLGGLVPADITGPLAMFQHTMPVAQDILRMLLTINQASSTSHVETAQLQATFDKFWPDLDTRLTAVQAQRPVLTTASRSDRDLLEELVILARYSARHIRDEQHADEFDDYVKFSRLMYMPLTELELSKHITDSLAAFGVFNIRQLAALEAKKISKIPGIAKADTKEVESCLNRLGLSLGMRFIDSMFPSIL